MNSTAGRSRLLRAVPIVTLLLFVITATSFAGGGNAGNPGVAPPQAHAHGKSYGQWSAAWWQWAFSLPIDHHPLFDTADCQAGQSGNVWFLGATFVTTIEPSGTVLATANRDCTVPPGTWLFFPIINTECSTLEGNGTTQAELLACASFFQNHAHDMTATIDGRAVNNIDRYRVQSPLFTYGPLPDNSVLEFFGVGGAVAGATSPAMADGVYLLLRPLSRGTHTIRFTGGQTFSTANGDPFDFDFELDITYHITVAPPGH